MNLYNLFEAPKRPPAPGTTGVMDNQVQSAASPIGSGTSRWESKKKPVTMMGVGNNGVVAEARDVQLDEISNKILGDYKKAAGTDASAADARGDVERGNKRFKGIVKATIKQGENDAKRHKQQGVSEGSLNEFAPGEGGFGPFKMYISNEFIEEFSTFDQAKEEIEFLRTADPKSFDADWKIIDGTGKIVWQHDPGEAIDAMRMRRKIQFIKPDDKGVAEGEKDTSRMNKQSQDFYNKNPNFKRDDRETKSLGNNRLATRVSPAGGVARVKKKPVTPFESQDQLDEIDRRGFLRGLGATALGAAGVGAASKVQADQQQELGNGFVLTTIDVAGHTVNAVLDTQSGISYTLNRGSNGSAIIRSPARYLLIKDGKIVDTAMKVGPSTAAAMQKAGLMQGVAEGVNHSALQGWDEMTRDQKRDALVKAGIIDSYNTLNKTPDQLDDILHAARVKAQNQEDELNIGASGRRELQRQAKQDFEEQRQQLHKEKMEMERFAWEKANTEAERKHEMAKIDKQYTQELRTLQMSHMQDMEKILHADTHELIKMKAEFNMRQAEREQFNTERPTRPQRPGRPQRPTAEPEDDFDQDTGSPLKPGFTRPQQWHTSQQLPYKKPPALGYKNDDATDVEPKKLGETGIGRAVNDKGLTQQRWLQLVQTKFPDAKIVCAKMIDGPCRATLPDGKTLSWVKVEQGTDGNNNSTGGVKPVGTGKFNPEFNKALQTGIDHRKAARDEMQAYVATLPTYTRKGVKESTGQDSKSWMASIQQQHPDVKFIQAKMPGAPIMALVNGKPVAQFDTKKGMAEGYAINENSDVLAGLTDILKMAASRQAPQNPRYFAQQVKDVALQLKDNPATQKWSNYLDGVVRWADVISSGKEQYSSGFANEVHSVLGPATRAYQDALLNKQGVAESMGRATPKMPKPRDPGHAILAAKRSSGAGGQHTNKRRQALLQPKHQQPLTRDMDMNEDISRRGFLRGAGAVAAGAAVGGMAQAADQADPNKLMVTVFIDGDSKEFDLTGRFKGDAKSQMYQASDFVTDRLEANDVYFSNMVIRFQGKILKTQNQGSVKEDLDESIERHLMQMRHAGYDI